MLQSHGPRCAGAGDPVLPAPGGVGQLLLRKAPQTGPGLLHTKPQGYAVCS
jgi:hypothetical protein